MSCLGTWKCQNAVHQILSNRTQFDRPLSPSLSRIIRDARQTNGSSFPRPRTSCTDFYARLFWQTNTKSPDRSTSNRNQSKKRYIIVLSETVLLQSHHESLRSCECYMMSVNSHVNLCVSDSNTKPCPNHGPPLATC